MARQVNWNAHILEEFKRLACLTELETHVINAHVKGYSITKQSHELNISESSIKRIIRRLKVKYDDAQKMSSVLPKRRKGLSDKG